MEFRDCCEEVGIESLSVSGAKYTVPAGLVSIKSFKLQMDDSLEREPDLLGEGWLRDWEDQAVEEWETAQAEQNMEDRRNDMNERLSQKLWLSFQNSATAISQLYRGKLPGAQIFVFIFSILMYR